MVNSSFEVHDSGCVVLFAFVVVVEVGVVVVPAVARMTPQVTRRKDEPYSSP